MNAVLNQSYKAIADVVNSYIKACYQLPKVPGKKVFYIVPLSGGIDSFATALILLALFPEQAAKFIFVHADTGIEAEGTAEALNEFEKLLGKSILRIKAKHDLLTMIELAGNYLPSQRNRSCTNMMKNIPFKLLYKALREKHGEDAVMVQFVGLRKDEPTRKGIEWKEDYIASAYPLQALGLVKADVNNIVQKTIGIPDYYANKSRSGCSVCPFNRRSEILETWSSIDAKTQFIINKAAKMENVPQKVVDIYNDLPVPLATELGVARNWLNYYRPSRLFNPVVECEGKRGKNKLDPNIVDLFGASEAKRLYVAVEYQFYGNNYGLCAEPFVYFEKNYYLFNDVGRTQDQFKKILAYAAKYKRTVSHE